MYIKVDGDKAEVVKHIEEDKPKILCVFDRIEDELEGFLKYKHMSKQHAKYNLPSMQEFQHMLLAWDDFVTELYPMLNPEEQAEFHKFVKSLSTMQPSTSTM